MSKRILRLAACCLALQATWPVMPRAQTPPQSAAAQDNAAQVFNTEQLDALLAPVALYPDTLLIQLLMASTYPLQVVQAGRWLEEGNNKSLSGDTLVKALESQAWDPSVKSLVAFPQVLTMMNAKLDWTQQVGYAFADQQAAVMDSVQRLRHQAQTNGSLESTPQQVVRTEQQAIVIEPAQPDVVYVPSYNPAVVYGSWPYPAYPPVYFAPQPAYPVGTALATGLAFGAGLAVAGGLWNWAQPGWGNGSVNVNVNRYNNLSTNGKHINSERWQANRQGGRPAGIQRPPNGPVGRPARPSGLPTNAIGRGQVSVPGSAVDPPSRASGGNRPGGGQAGAQPGAGNRPGGRPSGGQPGTGNRPGNQPGAGNRPGGGQVGGRPGGGSRPGSASAGRPGVGNRPGGGAGGTQPRGSGRPSVSQPRASPGTTQRARPSGQGAFGSMSNGRQASQFGQRGGQSRSAGQQRSGRSGGGVSGGRGGGRGGGGGGGRGGRR